MTIDPDSTLHLALLHDAFERSAAAWPERTAVELPGSGAMTYRALAALAGRVSGRLEALGAGRGDRVGIYLTKSIDAVAAIFGILRSGAAYVPVDPNAPAERNAWILADCRVASLVVERRFVAELEAALAPLGFTVPMIIVEQAGDGSGLIAALEPAVDTATARDERPEPDDLAYILYTSGSTGRPKGVMLTHRNATSFVGWCIETFSPQPDDRFSAHAPFHFDLSILDLFVPLASGATLVIVSHELGKDPARLAGLIESERITVWYSAPSILALLAQYGKLADRNLSALRTILFAGEVFPVKHLRALTQQLPGRRYFNLYGPTETNVCTWFEIPLPVPDDRTDPYPIGPPCPHFESMVVDEAGDPVPAGGEGELCVRGPAVTQGYWNLPAESARAFLTHVHGARWYRTGDLVVPSDDGYVFRGRRDRMIKKRGYRIELGEIEACLYRHPSIHLAAAIAVPGPDGLIVRAFVSPRGDERLSILALKQFSAAHLPLYMVPDQFVVMADLPKTSTDKINYQALQEVTPWTSN